MIYLYGSCQLVAIHKLLKDKLNKDVIVLENWTFMLNKNQLPESLYNCDVFIYQPFNGDEKYLEYHTDTILKKLNKNVKTISVPFVSCSIYFPDAIIDIRNNKTKTKNLPFGKFPQQSCILSKYKSQIEMMDEYNDNHYDFDFMSNFVQEILFKIHNVEKNCNIKIKDYIKYNMYNGIPLFHSIQHPNNNILIHMTKQILEILNLSIGDGMKLSIKDYSFNVQQELLRDHTVMILPCVQKFYNIKVSEYKLNGNGIVNESRYLVDYYNNINLQEIGFNFYNS
jgi:hypothetical protein